MLHEHRHRAAGQREMEMERKYPTIQKDNLRAVMAQIEAHPETWQQSVWHCGSSHCFMGWAQVLAGKPAEDDTVRVDGRKWLGLTAYEFDQLAAPHNTLDDLRDYVALFTSDGYNRAGYNRAGWRRSLSERFALETGARLHYWIAFVATVAVGLAVAGVR